VKWRERFANPKTSASNPTTSGVTEMTNMNRKIASLKTAIVRFACKDYGVESRDELRDSARLAVNALCVPHVLSALVELGVDDVCQRISNYKSIVGAQRGQQKLAFKAWNKVAIAAEIFANKIDITDADTPSKYWNSFKYTAAMLAIAEALDISEIQNVDIYALYGKHQSAIDRVLAKCDSATRAKLLTDFRVGVAESTQTTQRPTSANMAAFFGFAENRGNDRVVVFDRSHPNYLKALNAMGIDTSERESA